MENKISTSLENFKESTLKLKIIVCVILFLLLYALNYTELYYAELTPFGVSMVFALVFVGFNGYLLAIEFFVAYVLSDFSYISFIVAIFVSGVLCLVGYIKSRFISKDKEFKKWHLVILYIISLVGYVIVGVGTLRENLALFVSIVLSATFLFICLHFCIAVFRRGIWIGLNLDEKICGAIIFMVFMVGASAVRLPFFNLASLLVPIVILLCTYITNPATAIVVSCLTGVSQAIYYLEPSYIAMSVMMVLPSITFKGGIKIFSAIAVEFTYIICVLLFNMGVSISELVSISLGIVVFVFLPSKILSRLSNILLLGCDEIQENIIDRMRGQVEKKLLNLGCVFGEMEKTYRSLVRGVLDDEKAVALIKTDLVRGVCDSCPDKNNCYRISGSFVDNSLDMIVANGYERGKVLLVDLPQYLTAHCSRVNALISHLNISLSSYKDYVGAISNMDSSRIMIAEQLYATSRLLQSVAKEISTSVFFDKKLEKSILEGLRLNGIVCLSVSVCQKTLSVIEIMLIVSESTYNVRNIEKYVSKIMSAKMIILDKSDSDIPNAYVVNMVSSPNFDIAFGSAVIRKNGTKASGDTHSITKLEEGKYIVSLSDGMGSGDRASKISRLTVDLVENFYKGGFDSDIILSTINQFLALTEEENFATIDLCILDCRKNTFDFIKLASCNGYLLHDKGECEVIEGSNLPVGILENVRPHISRKMMSNMDMLLFFSDGVEDVLSEHLNIKDYVSSLDIKNPQLLSDTIMEKALELSDGVAMDDMTVIAVKIFACD
ncbi:MAG: hypothetical protein E7354_05400 [Clostridiales bacterium]|nr:hypothetical protein [Clostridiales bacterium]